MCSDPDADKSQNPTSVNLSLKREQLRAVGTVHGVHIDFFLQTGFEGLDLYKFGYLRFSKSILKMKLSIDKIDINFTFKAKISVFKLTLHFYKNLLKIKICRT